MKPRFSRHAAFTLAEILIASSVSLIVVLGVYDVVSMTNILTNKTTSINSTTVAIQNALNRIRVDLQQSYTVPYPLSASGAVLTSTLSISGNTAYPNGMVPVVSGTDSTVTGTGTGIKFYRYVGGPYLAQIPTTNLPSTAASITLLSSTSALVPPPVPQPGDVLLINTTALLASADVLKHQAWATVGGSCTYTTSGATRTYTVPLTPPLRPASPDATTDTTGIAYRYDNTSSSPVTWTTYLLRPTAFIVTYSNSSTVLGMIEPCVTTAGVVDLSQNYTRLVTLCSGSSPILNGSTPFFSIVSMGGNKFVSINLQAKSDSDSYLSGKQSVDGFSTYSGVRTMINLKSIP